MKWLGLICLIIAAAVWVFPRLLDLAFGDEQQPAPIIGPSGQPEYPIQRAWYPSQEPQRFVPTSDLKGEEIDDLLGVEDDKPDDEKPFDYDRYEDWG